MTDTKLPRDAVEFISEGMPALWFIDSEDDPCEVRITQLGEYQARWFAEGKWDQKYRDLPSGEVDAPAHDWIRAQWDKLRACQTGSVSEMARLEETDEEFRTRIKNTYGLGAPEVVTRERHDRARRRLLRKWLELQRIEYARQAEVESFYGEAEKEEKKLRPTWRGSWRSNENNQSRVGASAGGFGAGGWVYRPRQVERWGYSNDKALTFLGD
jgi:hypothetical protein